MPYLTQQGVLFLFAENEDFIPLNTTLEFSPGSPQQAISVMIIDDNQVEEVEFFSIQAAIDNETSTAGIFIAIQDNDGKCMFEVQLV